MHDSRSLEWKNEWKEHVNINEFNTKHAGEGPRDLYSHFLQSHLGTRKEEGSPLWKTNEKIQDEGKTVDTCFHHALTPGNGSCIVRPKLKPKRKGNKKQFPP